MFSYSNLVLVIVWGMVFGVFFCIGAYLFHASQSLNEMQGVIGFIIPLLVTFIIFGGAAYFAQRR